MSRKRKLFKTEQRARRKQRHQRRQQNSDVAKDTAGIFTCDFETARDFANQCEERSEDLDFDIAFSKLAYDIWLPHADRASHLATALAEFLSEKQRHLDAISAFRRRFADIAAQTSPDTHQHLEPLDPYLNLVRERLFPDPPST